MIVFVEVSIQNLQDEEEGRTECIQRGWGGMWDRSTAEAKF